MIRLLNVKKSFNKHKSNEIRAIDNTSIELADSGPKEINGLLSTSLNITWCFPHSS